MIRAVTFALALLGASPAIALSCLPIDLAGQYQRIAAAPDPYVVVHGRLSFDADLLPRTDWEAQQDTPPETGIPARLSGHALGRDGFKTRFDRAITLRVLCYGPWCANPPGDGMVLGFVKRVNGAYSLATDPCGGDAFFAPPPEMLKQVLSCHRGGPCRSAFPLTE